MNPNVTSSLSELSKGRRASESPNDPPLRSSKLKLVTYARSWLDKLFRFAFIRYLIAFFIGIAATLGWQSYSGGARQAIASWSPHLGWLAPAGSHTGNSAERIKATTVAFAAVRQSVDKLATELSKLQAQGTPDTPSAPPPSRSRRPGSRL
jgi:hypothetical protein